MAEILNSIENQQKWELFDSIISNVYRMKLSERDWLPDLKRAQWLLNEFKEYLWADPIQAEIEKRNTKLIQDEYLQSIEETKLKKQRRKELLDRFLEIQKDIGSQEAWYNFETLFYDLLNLEDFKYHPPYRNPHEQIDWYFNYEKFDYIVEIKATKEQAGNNEFAIFDWKIKSKWQSTRGFIVSMNGFCEHTIQSYSWNSPRIICMDWADFFLCLNDTNSFDDLLKYKVDAFIRKGSIYAK